MNRIVGFVGWSGAGKSTVVALLIARRGFVRLHAGNSVKRAVIAGWGLSDRQVDGDLRDVPAAELGGVIPRDFLEAIGRAATDAAPLASGIELARRMGRAADARIVVDGIRRQGEVDAVRRAGGMIIRINGRGALDPDKPMDVIQAAIVADALIENIGSVEELWDRLIGLIE